MKEVLDNYLNPTEDETTTATTEEDSKKTSEPALEGTTKTADVDDAFDELFNN